MTNIDIKIEKLLKLAKKNPKNYVKIADIYFDDSNFKKAENYYKKAIENGICAYQQLGYVYDYQHQYKKAFNTYLEGIDARDIDCMIYVGYNYEVGHIVKKDIKKAIEYYMMASNLGSAIAARNLGNIYYFDMPCKDDKNENVKKALGFYERAFYLGETSITKKIGFIYLNDETLKDVKKAIEWYKKGLNLGDHSLNFDLAYIYFNDRFVPHDYEKGYAYLIDGVKNNDPESLYMQARIYEEGWYGIKADEKKYIYYLKKAAKLGQDDALLDLGYYYSKRKNYDKALDCFAEYELDTVGLYWAIATICEDQKQDYDNALRYYQMAMEDNFPDAIERMAEAYLGDNLGLEKDEKIALKLFKKAARLGNVAAQYNLGMAYACGYYGLEANKEKAIFWLKKSAKGENPMACLQLGLYYYYTVKTKETYKKAFNLFKNAFNLGEKEAIVNVGLCYLQGNGIKENKMEAVKCFKMAANKLGSGLGFYNLGICYENGFGVHQDYRQAIEMYGKSVELGEKTGLEAIKRVYSKMNDNVHRA